MSDQQISRMGMPVDSLAIPHFTEVQEPQLVALVCSGRAGTKILQSFLDDHKNILMIPGYPLLYLYPHWATWQEQFSRDLSWERVIDLFCEKHASVLDSRRVAGLSGLERLGPQRDQHIEIDEQLFRNSLKIMLAGLPVSRRTFNLAVHYAYGICRRWDLNSDFILIYHLHDSSYLKEVSEDFPDLKVLNMIRNPGPSLHSTRRSLGIVDREKLNLTDSLRCIGRNFRFDCHLQFDFLDEMASYLSSDQVVSLRQESLHEHHEGSMKSLADWLGVEFSDSMLQSTFDGKAWWGDVTNETPVSGLDPAAMSDKWRGSISNTDSFVIEGISFQFFKRYNYKLTKYRHDSALNRLLLLCAVLLPSKAEWQTIGTYLDPRTHMRLLRAAFDESTGRIPRKDYTWNATYLYKWTYIDLKLWRPRWHERFLTFASRLPREGKWRWTASLAGALSRRAYVGGQYARFWAAILTFPVEISRRWRIYYGSLWRRVRGRAFLPRLLE